MHSEHNAARSLLQNDGSSSFDKSTLSIAFFVVVAVLLLIAAGCILWLCRTLIVHRADLSAPHRATPEETISQVALWVPNTSTPTTDGIAQSAPGLGRHTASSSLPLSEATANLRAATAPVSTGSTGAGPIPPAKGRQERRSCRQPKLLFRMDTHFWSTTSPPRPAADSSEAQLENSRPGAQTESQGSEPKTRVKTPQDYSCVICFENIGDHVLLPCGHSGYCNTCSRALVASTRSSKSCPVCRTQVTMATRVPVDTPIGAAVRPKSPTRQRDRAVTRDSTPAPSGEGTDAAPQLSGCRWQALNSRDASNISL